MAKALELIERNLASELTMESVASEANCSAFHFMRMFDIVTGMTPAEYIRRRRLSRAAIDLAATGQKIIDIAVAYGYDSADSFARAFKREFGCSPSEARLPGTKLHTYPPLSFTIALKGDKAMEYRIESGAAIKMTGLVMRANGKDGSNYVEIPAFWDAVMQDGRFMQLCKKAEGSKLGVAGVCLDFDERDGLFSYAIAIEAPANRDGLPEGCTDFEVPASTWAKFTSRGPLRPNLQETLKRIWSEWFPTSGREHAGTAEIEYYPPLPDPRASDYWCEYWIPIK